MIRYSVLYSNVVWVENKREFFLIRFRIMDKKIHKALVIDDTPEVLEFIMTTLNELEMFKLIITATDGLDAFRKLNNQDFDLVVLDINMPKMDGVQFLASYMKKDPKIFKKVIVISGEIDNDFIQKLNKMGLEHVLKKPFEFEDLYEHVIKILT